MPAAVAQVSRVAMAAVEEVVADSELSAHPLAHLLGSKMNLFHFDLFEHIFFRGWNHHDPEPPEDSVLARVWPE